ncbi:MAG: extracellular solute-binding protein [Paracoccus sp. (in: a-proteobacteria)]|uniref:extracellular solute-binding protein n=1 Tax=Paracoccus sp. TaxID=267 RepID=UPI0039E57E57
MDITLPARAGTSLRRLAAVAALASATALAPSLASADVRIEYWQYVFDSRVKAMDALIDAFEKENPDIKVKQVTFPYADYQTRVVAAHAAGRGPDVVQLFYGWIDNFVDGGILQPLPQDAFPAAAIEADFFPIVGAMKRDGQYYALPTAVRTMALFYNKKLFEQAGVTEPPKTLDELVEVAQKTAKHDNGGNLIQAGIALDIARQDHHWWRTILTAQYGGAPYSEDGKTVTYDSEAGLKALDYYLDLQTEYKVGKEGFMDEGQAAFRAGLAAMVVDGTFRLASYGTISAFEWGVTELPAAADGTRSNYASYFANGIGSSAKGEELEASKKFLAYISSPAAMELWQKEVGELPARKAVAMTEANLADPVFGPFVRALDYSQTTRFVDEAAQRQVAIDMVNRVLLQGQAPAESLAEAAKAEQALLDKHFAK